MTAYYNEIDPYAAQWLRNLITAGHIADGVVDERSIVDVKPEDLRGFSQCHFFAGIGVWSPALRRAEWPDERPVWTGSCPCQPFSAAGKQSGFDDERHLWPVWFNLIRECRPPVVFGEQVEAAINLGWLDLVQSDMERENYAFAAVGTPACGIGAPHIRQRLWFVGERNLADAKSDGWREGQSVCNGRIEGVPTRRPNGRSVSGSVVRMADPDNSGFNSHAIGQLYNDKYHSQPCDHSSILADPDPDDARLEGYRGFVEEHDTQRRQEPTGLRSACGEFVRPFQANSFWANPDWLFCRDGKWRPVESGTFPLAHGITNRVGRLRAYGNAICAPVAEAFIRSYMEIQE